MRPGNLKIHFACPARRGKLKPMPRKAKLPTGNVFADIGTPNADEHALKADVAIKIGMLIESKKISQTQAAKLTGISQPDLSRLLRGHFEGFSMDRLFQAILSLGSDVEITLKRPAGNRQGRARVLSESFG
jgi:predicted XRE-type DNA-binding protein